MSLAIRFQGGTSTGANLSPNRCRNRSRRCSSPEKSGGRSAPPPSSTFFAGATAWLEWAMPCWRTDAIPHRSDAFHAGGFEPVRHHRQRHRCPPPVGQCQQRRQLGTVGACIVVAPPEPDLPGRVVERRLQQLLSRHRSAFVSTQPRCPRNAPPRRTTSRWKGGAQCRRRGRSPAPTSRPTARFPPLARASPNSTRRRARCSCSSSSPVANGTSTMRASAARPSTTEL